MMGVGARTRLTVAKGVEDAAMALVRWRVNRRERRSACFRSWAPVRPTSRDDTKTLSRKGFDGSSIINAKTVTFELTLSGKQGCIVMAKRQLFCAKHMALRETKRSEGPLKMPSTSSSPPSILVAGGDTIRVKTVTRVLLGGRSWRCRVLAPQAWRCQKRQSSWPDTI